MKEKNYFTLGVDIGSYSIKCVELAWEENAFKLSQIAKTLVDPSSKEGVHESLQRLFSKKTFSARKLRVAVSGPSLIVRRIQMPRLTYAELKSAIRFEAESHIPFPIDDCVLDFQILGEASDKKTMQVLLVAAKRDLVQERLRVAAPLGMDVELVDVTVFGTINAFEKLGENTDERVQGLLNIGCQGSSFAILQEKSLFYVREMAMGSSQITKALSAMKGISEDEAEKLKLENPSARAAEIAPAAEKGLEPLAEELRTAIDYFENESGESLKGICLSGGGSLLPFVPSVLSEELGRPVSVWDGSKKLPGLPAADKELAAKNLVEFDVALGLALRGVKTGK